MEYTSVDDLQRALADPAISDGELAKVLGAALNLEDVPPSLLQAFRVSRDIRRDVVLLNRSDLLARLQEVSDILLDLLRARDGVKEMVDTGQRDGTAIVFTEETVGAIESRDCATLARAIVALSREYGTLRGYYNVTEPMSPEELNKAFTEEEEDAVVP